ncbi:adenine deaminase [Marinimicrococcus flavescens]|uniref:Adenine deaminase n=1 Tax=Marinimicrococcus flavescens TaxID=3031815 RepID=A0AAP3XSS6_9PROT|nr:adenine deaminase C-terminal domain-containing protein [Marinimicrococcus flavescens]
MTSDLADRSLRARAVAAARGQARFDLLLEGGTVVDVATGELREADVGIIGPLIASVHPRGARTDAASRLDCTGRFIAPGFIDMHMHVESSMMVPRTYAQTVVPQGTTTAVWDPHELANVLGLEGVRWAIAASRGLPLRFVVLAPSCVPSAPGLELAGAEIGGEEMREMLSWPEIAGVAEVMDMRGVLEGSGRMRAVVGEGLASGKLVCGHARSLAGADLQAFAAAGIGSDHELVSGEDLLAKLRAGFTVELRGSHPYLLPECVAALRTLPLVPQTLTLCTDDVFPDDLVAKGGMIALLRLLVEHGLDPVQALRCATLNAAMRLGRADLGLVAAGRRADLVVLEDLSNLAVAHTIASGRHVAIDGAMLEDLPGEAVPAPTGTVRVSRLEAADFIIRVPEGCNGQVPLRVVQGARFTRWAEAVARVENGRAVLPPELSLMAVVHRHGRRPPVPALAPLGDWGCWRGAIATTVSHDSHNLAVFGREPADMAAAANALIESGGGMAVAREGRVIAHLRLPVAGLLSQEAPEKVAAAFAALKQAADEVGDWKPPYRVFKAIVGASLACNAGPHLTDLGLTDGTTGEVFVSAVL